MKTLFTDIKEIIDYVSVDISGNFKKIRPYMIEAHRYVLKGMDQATFSNLLAYVEDNSTGDTDLAVLLEYARRVLANFAYAVAAKRLGVSVGENGMLQFSNDKFEPLSAERLDQLKSEFYNAGFNALETMILFIQENSDKYPDAYAHLFTNTFFVSTAKELNELIFTDVPNRDFFEMKPEIFLVEQEIEGIVGTETFNVLKAVQKETLITDDQQKMLSMICPAEACIAYGIKYKSPRHEAKGNQLLESLRIFYASISAIDIETYSNENKSIYVFR